MAAANPAAKGRLSMGVVRLDMMPLHARLTAASQTRLVRP
jgi:hypothetical protein